MLFMYLPGFTNVSFKTCPILSRVVLLLLNFCMIMLVSPIFFLVLCCDPSRIVIYLKVTWYI